MDHPKSSMVPYLFKLFYSSFWLTEEQKLDTDDMLIDDVDRSTFENAVKGTVS